MSATAAVMVPQKGVPESTESEAKYSDARWAPMMSLPCSLAVALAFPKFKVSDFVALRPGSVISTGWSVTKDVPLQVNGALIGWGELESSTNHLAVRITELA